MKRPRSLSAEERDLWDSVAKQAKPLRKKKRAVVAKVLSHKAPRTPEPKARASSPVAAPPSGRGVGGAEKTAPGLSAPHPCGGPRRELALKRSEVGGAAQPESAKPSLPRTHPLDRREKSRLARGHREIDARIDLHGMTQARAHRALLGFLLRAQADGSRYVLVITGKGKVSSDGSERGVLRRQVPEWLGLADFRALVTGYEQASIGHGGEGALYVRVRRG